MTSRREFWGFGRGMARGATAAVCLGVLVSARFSAAGMPTTGPSTTGPASTGPASTAPAATTSTSTPLHSEMVNDYMGGNWLALETLIREKATEIEALTPNEAEDVKIIRQAMIEGRPAWWATAKKGKEATFNVSLWGRSRTVTFYPDNKGREKSSKSNPVTWEWANMDSQEMTAHLTTKGDWVSLDLFTDLGFLDAMNQPKTVKGRFYSFFDVFRGAITGVTYTTPPGRRNGIRFNLRGYQDKLPEGVDDLAGNRAVGMFFMMESMSHPDLYPSMQLPKKIKGEINEDTLALAFLAFIERKAWTFAEDTAMREALRKFAVANDLKAYTSGAISFPESLSMSPSIKTDVPLREKRNEWLKAQFEKNGGSGEVKP